MNFADKLKQLRIQKNWTQPQMAQVLGIEQSYLSKLENDKCLPSADMFRNILHKLEIEQNEFLNDLDSPQFTAELKQIPEVSDYLSAAKKSRLQIIKRYLFISALLCVLGLSAIIAARRELAFSNQVYVYVSPGVIQAGEPDNLYEKFRELTAMKLGAGLLDLNQMNQAVYEFESKRLRPVQLETDRDTGTEFFRQDDQGKRKFNLSKSFTRTTPVAANRYLELVGYILAIMGLLGFIVEWRTRALHLNQQ